MKSQKKRVQEWIALLSDPSKFNKGFMAANKAGKPVLENSRAAVRWCASGMAYKLKVDHSIRRKVARVLGMEIGTVNDGPDGRRRVLSAVKKIAKDL